MIQGLIHPLVFRQKFNSKYYSKHDFPEKFNSKNIQNLVFQKYSIQKLFKTFFLKYSIQKVIHFRISEEIQFKNIIQNWIFSWIQFKKIIQNWIFSWIQFKKIFIQYQKRSTSHGYPILIVSLWRPYSLRITYILLTSLNDDDTGDTGVLSVWLDIEYALQTVYG